MSIVRAVIRSGITASLLHLSPASAQPPVLPDFLPAYYIDALTLDGKQLQRVSSGTPRGKRQATFATTNRATLLTVESIACDRTYCDVLYEKQRLRQNETLKRLAGQFTIATSSEFAVAWKSGLQRREVVVTKLPRTVMVWTLASPAAARPDRTEWRTRLLAAANQQRYRDARLLGPVEVGRWAAHSHRYARDLLRQGNVDAALPVLNDVVTWAPYLFEAQLDMAENTKDDASARASALAVWENAESAELTARAGKLLGRSEATWQSLPVIDSSLRGLQVVLIPLQPSEIRLVEQAAGLLSRILDVPVRLARLPDEWHWGVAQRLYRQRDVQSFIEQKRGKSVDFANWTLQRYRDELVKAVANDDPLTKFQLASFSQELGTRPGQYLAGAPVLELFQTIQALRSDDRRTMYVGVTETDIYTGEANYAFTSGWRQGDFAAAISSYARMKAAAPSEQYESRARLIQRMAKELVPAALQQLGIPRPVDPADPYSYSDSVDRVSQKTLTLSAPTRAALDRFRGGP